MQVRAATKDDLDAVCKAFEASRAYMASHGNPNQWGDDYPSAADARADLLRGTLFVCTDEKDEVVGCLTFAPGPDPDYRVIDGAWLNKAPYFVVHRVATLRQGEGVGGAMLDWVCATATNVRTDTHAGNASMQALLASRSFVPCGTVRLARAGERQAYHFVRETDELQRKRRLWEMLP